MLVQQVNEDTQLYAHAQPGKAPKLTVPRIKPKELKVTLLKHLLTRHAKASKGRTLSGTVYPSVGDG
jgi:hypothetical protein